MRNLVVSMLVTADGVVEAPHEWSGQFRGDDSGAFKHGELFESDALLLGRETYDGFAAAWPSRSNVQGFAERINNLPKHVVSSTLTAPAWNNTHVIHANVMDEVAALKQTTGQNILVYGSAQLMNSLIPHGLIDELRLMIFPIVLGTGKRLFSDGTKSHLALTSSKIFDSGVVLLTYQPTASA